LDGTNRQNAEPRGFKARGTYIKHLALRGQFPYDFTIHFQVDFMKLGLREKKSI